MKRTLVGRQLWICSDCLRQSRKRFNSTAATATASIANDLPYHDIHISGSSHEKTEKAFIRDVFNERSFWRGFSQKAKSTSGLIGNRYLTNPDGFQKFAATSLQKCKELVARTLAASSQADYVRLPRDLDRLSDLLCRVIDLSDFVRTIHPDQRVARAAHNSYTMMYQYMNELNTTTGLNKQLKVAWSTPEVQAQWTREEKMVAQILLKDFTKSGIDLPDRSREEFVNISNEIATIGTDFVSNMQHESNYISASSTELNGVNPDLTRNVSSWGKSQIPLYSPIAEQVLGSAHSPEVKKRLYIAERTASRSTIGRLEQLLLHRAKLAQLTGYSTYAELTLSDKMAKTPAAVNNFLASLNMNNQSQVSAEIDRLLTVKRSLGSEAGSIDPWEHRYLVNQLQLKRFHETRSRSQLLQSVSSYFAVGHVIQGLSSLFESLYGVRLVPQETKIGEVWHQDVRRLDVFNDRDEQIATMYCDLFSRPGKMPNPAHFTLLCSREISVEEVEEAQRQDQPVNLGMPVRTRVDETTGQTRHLQSPIIALVCDFAESSDLREPSLLSPNSVTTLFHEMGHAIHSILGQTSMQGISGTRCPTDFAELPSVLMEYFASDAAVLQLFARHWSTDTAMPAEMVKALQDEKTSRAELSGGWDNQTQILMAMLDQTYHADGPVHGLVNGKYNSTDVFHETWLKNSTIQEPNSTSWQGFFGHLYGYGATYYSYLFDRAIARQVWRAVFRDGIDQSAVDRHAGERYKEAVLRWGGGRDPWVCLEDLMGDGRGILGSGGREAMELVGEWGVGAGSEGQM